MKDVAALCRRAVIIAQGRVIYDGSLEGIRDRFSDHKVVTLDFADDAVPQERELAEIGTVVEMEPPRVKLRVPRGQVPELLARVLATYTIADVSVEDPPLEEVIAEMFESVADEPQRVSSAGSGS
jgi:ABC-2 type transport system ATP-binding protein